MIAIIKSSLSHHHIPHFKTYQMSITQLALTVLRHSSSDASTSNPFIGPAPSHPPLPGDPGHDELLENLKFFKEHNRYTTLSHEQMAAIKLSQPDLVAHVLGAIEKTQREVHEINTKIDEIRQTLQSRNTSPSHAPSK